MNRVIIEKTKTLEEQHEELRAQITYLGIKIEEAQGVLKEYDGLTEKKAQLETEVADLLKQKEENTSALAALSGEVEVLKNQKSAHEESLGAAMDDKAAKEHELDVAIAEKDSLFQSKEAELRNIAASVDETQKKLDALLSRVHETKEKHDKLTAEHSALLGIIEHKKTELSSVEQSIADARDVERDVLATASKKQSEFDELDLKIKAAKLQLSQLVVDIAEANDTLNSKIPGLEKALVEREVQIVKREGELSEYASILKSKRERLLATHKQMEDYFGKPLKEFKIEEI